MTSIIAVTQSKGSLLKNQTILVNIKTKIIMIFNSTITFIHDTPSFLSTGYTVRISALCHPHPLPKAHKIHTVNMEKIAKRPLHGPPVRHWQRKSIKVAWYMAADGYQNYLFKMLLRTIYWMQLENITQTCVNCDNHLECCKYNNFALGERI